MDTGTADRKVTPLREELVYRQPPHNYDAEQALLGAILVDNRTFDRVHEFLRPDHFFDVLHGRIYEAIARLIEREAGRKSVWRTTILCPLHALPLTRSCERSPLLHTLPFGAFLVMCIDKTGGAETTPKKT